MLLDVGSIDFLLLCVCNPWFTYILYLYIIYIYGALTFLHVDINSKTFWQLDCGIAINNPTGQVYFQDTWMLLTCNQLYGEVQFINHLYENAIRISQTAFHSLALFYWITNMFLRWQYAIPITLVEHPHMITVFMHDRDFWHVAFLLRMECTSHLAKKIKYLHIDCKLSQHYSNVSMYRAKKCCPLWD